MSHRRKTRDRSVQCANCAKPCQGSPWPATRADELRGIECVCFKCGGRGHTAGDCPSPTLCNACRSLSSLPCSICFGIGHRAADCSSALCRKCGARGHYDNDCVVMGPVSMVYTVHLNYPGEDLGVVLARKTQDQPMTVAEVVPGSPAWEAGIEKGCRIVTFDGHRLDDEHTLYNILQNVYGRLATKVVIEGSVPSQDRFNPRRLLVDEEAKASPITRGFAGSGPPIPRPPVMNPFIGVRLRNNQFV